MTRDRRVALLGGTFDPIHPGHAAMFRAAFQTGTEVRIGLTTDAYLARHPKPWASRIRPYPARRRNLARWLRAHYPGRAWTIRPLEDRWGHTANPDVDALVVSFETGAAVPTIQLRRRRRGLRPLEIVRVPAVLASDGAPISSRRIRSGELTRTGRPAQRPSRRGRRRSST
jgi:pantetheine-phosphate adenylyltransferase